MGNKKKLIINDIEVSLNKFNDEDYLCISDMAKFKDSVRTDYIIQNWLRTKSTIEFIGLWEQLNNNEFNSIEYDGIRNESGSNSFSLTPKKWIESTKAIGIKSKSGRYGGTYAHKDIAFEFATWISPAFKLWLIKEFQRLKELENSEYNLEWNVKRILSKVNYRIHTDAIKEFIIPKSIKTKENQWLEYANEADILNVAMFGFTAKQWKDSNPELASKGYNIRDIASINELTVLSNLESTNAGLIRSSVNKKTRFIHLKKTAESQLKSIEGLDIMKSIRKSNPEAFLELKEKKELNSFDKNLKKALDYNPKK